MSDSRPLSLVVHLMFCLRPTNEDWEHPDLPYLYSDLDSEDEMHSIATLVQFISRPVTTKTMFRSTLSPARIIDFLEPKVSFDFYRIFYTQHSKDAFSSERRRFLLSYSVFPLQQSSITLESRDVLCWLCFVEFI